MCALEKEEKSLPRVAAIHDLAGMGSCSLNVVLPTLAAMGLVPCAAPTAILAAHTDLPSYTFFDCSDLLDDCFQCWKKLGLSLQGAYSGFLGSAQQIESILRFAEAFPDMPLFIDPVMGDGGRRYRTYTDALCQEMRRLASRADLLMPNLTEASILLNEPYPGANLTSAEAERMLDRLLEGGAQTVIIKGIARGDGRIVNAVKGRDFPYDEESHPLYAAHFHGTGDLFASVLVSAVLRGLSLPASLRLAGELTGKAVAFTMGHEILPGWGVNFTPLLPEFAGALAAALADEKAS